MQRLSTGLMVKRTYAQGGTQLCELPDGSWQVGTERGGAILQRVEDLEALQISTPGIKQDIAASIERIVQAPPSPPEESLREEAHRRVDRLSDQHIYDLVMFLREREAMELAKLEHIPEAGVDGLRDRQWDPGLVAAGEMERVPGGALRRTAPDRPAEFIPEGAGTRVRLEEALVLDRPDAPLERDNQEAAPAYACIFCERAEWTGEHALQSHQRQCSKNPNSRFYRPE